MTLFDFNRCSEIKEAGWSENTLRPPLKINEIMLDFKIQWLTYCSRKMWKYSRISARMIKKKLSEKLSGWARVRSGATFMICLEFFSLKEISTSKVISFIDLTTSRPSISGIR